MSFKKIQGVIERVSIETTKNPIGKKYIKIGWRMPSNNTYRHSILFKRGVYVDTVKSGNYYHDCYPDLDINGYTVEHLIYA